MATLLLLVIFIAFIGLGIPDSLLGVAWPSIYQSFNIPVSYASFISVTSTIGSTISSLCASRVINKFGTKYVVLFSTMLTVVGLSGFYFTNHFIFMIICSIPLGLGAGAIDTALNNYVAVNFSSSVMSYLHCFYGIGISISPYFMAYALRNSGNYRNGYLYAVISQVIIVLILFISLPLWNRNKDESNESEESENINLSIKQMISNPLIFTAGLAFFLYCGAEIATSNWAASFLVNVKNFSKDQAAVIAGLFYIGLALGRLTAGFLVKKFSNLQLVKAGELLLLVALCGLFIDFSPVIVSSVSLFLVGFGCGPIFPCLMSMTPDYYGNSYSQAITGFQIAFANISALSISPLLGVIANKVGFTIAPYYLLFVVILLVIDIKILSDKLTKPRNKNDLA